MSTIEHKIIELLSNYPEEEFYAQEVAKRISCSKSSSVIILKKLTEKSAVKKKTRGHMKFYQINPNNLEVKQIKIASVLKGLSPLLRKIKNTSQKIILFGSTSRGEQTAESDIDLLIITNEKKQVEEAIKTCRLKTKINPVIKTPSQWSEMETKDPEFYREVNSGIILHNHVPRI